MAPNDKIKVLMIEDSLSLSAIYMAYLADSRYRVITVETLARAYNTLDGFAPDIVLLDIELPDGNGLELLDNLSQFSVRPCVIVMTAHGTSELAVTAVRKGAFDFLTKPFDGPRLKVTLDNAVTQIQLGQKANQLATLERDSFCGFIGKSLAMQAVYKTIDSLAASSATGFIVGESGTGKELAAEAIHQQSPRRDKAFVAINCGAIPSE